MASGSSYGSSGYGASNEGSWVPGSSGVSGTSGESDAWLDALVEMAEEFLQMGQHTHFKEYIGMREMPPEVKKYTKMYPLLGKIRELYIKSNNSRDPNEQRKSRIEIVERLLKFIGDKGIDPENTPQLKKYVVFLRIEKELEEVRNMYNACKDIKDKDGCMQEIQSRLLKFIKTNNIDPATIPMLEPFMKSVKHEVVTGGRRRTRRQRRAKRTGRPTKRRRAK